MSRKRYRKEQKQARTYTKSKVAEKSLIDCCRATTVSPGEVGEKLLSSPEPSALDYCRAAEVVCKVCARKNRREMTMSKPDSYNDTKYPRPLRIACRVCRFREHLPCPGQVWVDMMVDEWQVVGRRREGVLRFLEE
jgi:hypothetical protein